MVVLWLMANVLNCVTFLFLVFSEFQTSLLPNKKHIGLFFVIDGYFPLLIIACKSCLLLLWKHRADCHCRGLPPSTPTLQPNPFKFICEENTQQQHEKQKGSQERREIKRDEIGAKMEKEAGIIDRERWDENGWHSKQAVGVGGTSFHRNNLISSSLEFVV